MDKITIINTTEITIIEFEKEVRDFGSALKALKEGYRVTREGWFGNVYLELQVPDAFSKMTLPYIYMVKGANKFPCDLSCESIMAEDWTIVD